MAASDKNMMRVYRYRLYPTDEQDAQIRWTLERLRELYNAALDERREAWRKQRVSRTRFQQTAELVELKRICPDFKGVYSQVLQNAIHRLDKAFQAFFRRCKAGEKPGYPRFKGHGRYNSFTYPQASKRCGAWIDEKAKRLHLTKIGDVKIKLHRKIEGRLKQVTVTLGGDGHWYACLCCDNVPEKPLPKTGQSVGVDVGIKTFAALSTGEMVENPKLFETNQAKLRRAQRVLCRRKRGSSRRRKAVLLVRGLHDKIRRSRLDFHHKVAVDLVRRFDSIAVEDLNVKALARSRLAKQVQDAGWAQFAKIVSDKAACAGREFVKVNPRGTSQICSGCGTEVRKDLSVRVHSCPHCGLVVDRDVNAAINVLSRAGARTSGRDAQWLAQ